MPEFSTTHPCPCRLFTEVPLPEVERLEQLKGKDINDAKVCYNATSCSAVHPSAHTPSLAATMASSHHLASSPSP